jgi:acyl-coenzyme A synthetase/AMP-(fatty) acid ligase
MMFPVVYDGILRAGAVVVPVSTMFRRSEVAYHLADCGARMHFCAAALPVDVLNRFQERFGVSICEGYGLARRARSLGSPDGPSRPGSIGMPLWGIETTLLHPDRRPSAPGGSGELGRARPQRHEGLPWPPGF